MEVDRLVLLSSDVIADVCEKISAIAPTPARLTMDEGVEIVLAAGNRHRQDVAKDLCHETADLLGCQLSPFAVHNFLLGSARPVAR